jgi:hypothetical protein
MSYTPATLKGCKPRREDERSHDEEPDSGRNPLLKTIEEIGISMKGPSFDEETYRQAVLPGSTSGV